MTCSNGPNGDLFTNYMDYTDDRGMVMFTNGQVARMQACLDTVRSSLPIFGRWLQYAGTGRLGGGVGREPARRVRPRHRPGDVSQVVERLGLGTVGHRLRVHGWCLYECS